MKVTTGTVYEGPAGSATEVLVEGPFENPAHAATVASWFLHCPGQSPAWSRYLLSVVHLRRIPGVKAADARLPHVTHELIVAALDPYAEPKPGEVSTWRLLHPINVTEQVQLPNDDAARRLAAPGRAGRGAGRAASGACAVGAGGAVAVVVDQNRSAFTRRGACTVNGHRRGPARLYVDHHPGSAPEPGDSYVTSTGQGYLVLEARLVQRGPRTDTRSYVLAERMPGAGLPEDSWRRSLRWYPRGRRRVA